ncbi:MAG: bifunctional 4-hydroxy-2-oxoglutarate aldolase/2-dehydro-3-deoxy-phosphogluconate aldolase [Anaerolineales bacterium]|nr:bifunctional 4-hydroxy-2-oxoglutarate aldolase/2-dehydro-3-deoxy-phosphogluconate aldolase [Anaerolineales bacterium]MCS7248368.1 bifunctional 4-hydroxy-2-oxoglutarate aldolase/2-dehydro-3-deoxy-phosphogluconate aldolase [Anaerolineales bacterium]MDW8162181.1 bifunctional 4-hydroxy-2-oxoglutarate aldolase/2-dehydro-3-deoxy-phosphogluconate aldolase [Anaerolineales bacterium]MDW8447044.1 bifunctional 4-hydroxy-2-oxoglutarate aldolase/2-dehydro-3-deoxy-phosphogluconate aldolase [Anaerolineales 
MEAREMLSRLEQQGIIPIVTLEDAQDAEWVCKILHSAGMQIVEITFRTQAAAQSIEIVKAHLPELIVGAGTVLTQDQASKAYQAGASFLVSPGLDLNIVRWAQERDLLVIPGVITPTEILSALHQNITLMKFFPAESYGGIKALSALRGPFPQVKFLPTGGINPQNAADYLALSNVIAVGGTWMVTPELIRKREQEVISKLACEAIRIANQRGS